jgi:adenine specific DNA methylase Mod
MTKEKKFFEALQGVFIGAKVEGDSGFVNLMRIKSGYYSKIEKILLKDIEDKLKGHASFREELFVKLYDFFHRYFTESGSIYFNSTPFHNNIYERVYTDDKDVILFWKTQMLYYVKTDRIFRSMPVEFEGFKFYFDASDVEHKKSNEKRSLVYEFKSVKADGTVCFLVHYSERGKGTKTDDIIAELRKKNLAVKEEQLEKVFRVFEKQSEVDYFINKNAREFLKEQFKLWLYQYTFDGDNVWTKERIDQLQILKDTAYKIIDFIAQFEDELVKIWNKPKFVLDSNYVITLDRIATKNSDLIEEILKHDGMTAQIKEWKELGIIENGFKAKDILEKDLTGKHLKKELEHLPIDTKYFKDLELEILRLFDNLDKTLDGWLIKSENYQALNTILPKFKGKVQTIYIDPPFNTGDDFPYVDRFQDSTWLSIINDRAKLGLEYLNDKSNYFVHLDENANHLGKILISGILNLTIDNEIVWDKGFRGTESKDIFQHAHDTIFMLKSSDAAIWNQPTQMYKDQNLGRYDKVDADGKKYALIKRTRTDGTVYYGKTYPKDEGKSANDVISYIPTMASTNKQRWENFKTQKPEELLQVIIESSSNRKSLILDYFSGSGTTLATAHKSGRRWIGIEMGDYFENILLARMKEVLACKGEHEPCGISEDVNWQGGGFFKYYKLEQYDQSLKNTKYSDGDIFSMPGESPYASYVFMKDEKML